MADTKEIKRRRKRKRILKSNGDESRFLIFRVKNFKKESKTMYAKNLNEVLSKIRKYWLPSLENGDVINLVERLKNNKMFSYNRKKRIFQEIETPLS
jgi:hypothetical protein